MGKYYRWTICDRMFLLVTQQHDLCHAVIPFDTVTHHKQISPKIVPLKTGTIPLVVYVLVKLHSNQLD